MNDMEEGYEEEEEPNTMLLDQEDDTRPPEGAFSMLPISDGKNDEQMKEGGQSASHNVTPQ